MGELIEEKDQKHRFDSHTRDYDHDHNHDTYTITSTGTSEHNNRGYRRWTKLGLRVRIIIYLVLALLTLVVLFLYAHLNQSLESPTWDREKGATGKMVLPTPKHKPTPKSKSKSKLEPSNYTVVQGLFKQSDPEFQDDGYDVLGDSFGLIDDSEERWINFEKHISKLNQEAGEQTTYKVIYLSRHGQGVHNLAEEKYGTPAWNCKWSLLETDGELVWGPDPVLTPHGREQIKATAEAWRKEIEAHIPIPEVLYSSPLRRAIDTVQLTWNEISLKEGTERHIKENLREMIGLHTCDKRSTRSFLEKEYPQYIFDDSFTESDELWTPDHQEQSPSIARRARSFLDQLFAEDDNTYVSITAHGGFIGGFLSAVGHRQVAVQTGGLIPIVLRATWNPDEGMDPIKGGHQSGTAPACSPTSGPSFSTSGSVGIDDEVDRETRGVAQSGGLVIQSP